MTAPWPPKYDPDYLNDRRKPPPFAPDYDLIECRGCGRRLFDDEGKTIKVPWWQFWKWGC